MTQENLLCFIIESFIESPDYELVRNFCDEVCVDEEEGRMTMFVKAGQKNFEVSIKEEA